MCFNDSKSQWEAKFAAFPQETLTQQIVKAAQQAPPESIEVPGPDGAGGKTCNCSVYGEKLSFDISPNRFICRGSYSVGKGALIPSTAH